MSKGAGFTLMELVIVIVILAILSATVAPKFFSSNGFSEYAYRTDVIAKLRLIQTRAMQQVNDKCHQVMVTSTKLGKVKQKTGENICINPAEFADQAEKRASLVEISSTDNVGFTSTSALFSFDFMGRPLNAGSNERIDITITGEQALTVRIESEGYIHAL